MSLLGIDIGTTHSKVGLFDLSGQPLAIASRATITHQAAEGYNYYDPEEMWSMIGEAIQEVMAKAAQLGAAEPKAIGITSMAESGLLVDRASGEPRSPFMPWFDTCSQKQAELISAESDALERFSASGLHNSFKLGLAKLLWIREQDASAIANAVWLSSSSYIAYRLTGQMAFDYSLAARTYAFRIDEKRWDADWLAHFGLSSDLFPEALPGGSVMGNVSAELATLGLKAGIPVAIAGHDHVSAALAVGAVTPEIVYDSMGTAETLVGTLSERKLGKQEFDSGLSYGCHIAKDRFFWMGGNSSSGGSIEWLRSLLADEALSYEQLLRLLDTVPAGATGMLYYPYLSGSGAPQPDPRAKASIIGLTKAHGKGELIKAVLEGTAYQLESIRRGAERIANRPIETLVVVGGGTRNRHWLQIKADVSGCTLELPPIPEASLLGAAMAAGVGSGVYASAEEVVAAVSAGAAEASGVDATNQAQKGTIWVRPNEVNHAEYRRLYENGYVPLQAPLRTFFK